MCWSVICPWRENWGEETPFWSGYSTHSLPQAEAAQEEEEREERWDGRRESVGCPEGRDTDQSNPSLSKKLKGCVVDLLLAREKHAWGEGNSGMLFPPGAKIPLCKH